MSTKTVIEMDIEFVQRIETSIKRIEQGMENLKALKKQQYLTPDEFIEHIKVSRWKFEIIKNQGLFKNIKRIGRKFYIHESEVERFFSGELDIKK